MPKTKTYNKNEGLCRLHKGLSEGRLIAIKNYGKSIDINFACHTLLCLQCCYVLDKSLKMITPTFYVA